MEPRKPIQHRMTRRAAAHDYTRPGIYHITLHVTEALGQPLGTVMGMDADSAAVSLTPVGERVAHELTTAITAHYEMITVDEHVVMPEHLHFILIVRAPIVSKSGRTAHLGQVIAGFKAGCNRAFWAATGQTAPATPAATKGALTAAAAETAAGAAAFSAPGGFAAKKARYNTGRPPLFAPGYCDVQPIEPGQLETQRAYIRNNPRSRWQRSHDRARLQTRRGGIDTAVTPAALRRFLQQECPPKQATPEVLAAIEARLLLSGGNTLVGKTTGRTERGSDGMTAATPAPAIVCDSYGDRALLQQRLLPVVCHRADEARRAEQKARCLEEAARGAVLVSPRIAPGEQAIIDEAANRGFATIIIADNGFPEVYHPSTERVAACAAGRLLLVTPWQYQFRPKNEQITVPFCKTMNCVAQALCRTKDSWWKEPVRPAASPLAASPAVSPQEQNPNRKNNKNQDI